MGKTGQKKVVLNLGCGSDIKKQWMGCPCINVDIRQLEGVDEIWDVRILPIEDNMIDYILASDIIEHFPISETPKLLGEWARVLIPGGILEIRTPSLKYLAEDYLKRKDAKFTSYHLFGGQDYSENYHYVIFDREWLSRLCKSVGLEEIEYNDERTNFRMKLRKR